MKNYENTFLIELTFNFEYKYMTTKTFYSNSRLGDGRKPNVRTLFLSDLRRMFECGHIHVRRTCYSA